MNLYTNRPLLDCGHAPAPHHYWHGNAHEAASGRMICHACQDGAGERERRSTTLYCGHTASPSKHCMIPGYYHSIETEGTYRKDCCECSVARWLREMEDTGQFYWGLSLFESGRNHLMDPPIEPGAWAVSLGGVFSVWARVSVGRHNLAGVRRDCWFSLAGKVWHGVQVGNTTGGALCKRTQQDGSPGPSYADLVNAMSERAEARTRRDRAADLLGLSPSVLHGGEVGRQP